MTGREMTSSSTALLLIFVVARSSLAVIWVSSPVEQVRPLNGTATFDCLVGGAGVGNRTVLWTRTGDDGARRTLFIDEAPFDAPARYRSTRARGGSGYRLTIVRIRAVDDAEYSCEIQKLAKASARLTVLGDCHGCFRRRLSVCFLAG